MVLDTESMGKARVWGHVVSLVRLFLAAYCCGLRQCGRLGRVFCRMDHRDYATCNILLTRDLRDHGYSFSTLRESIHLLCE